MGEALLRGSERQPYQVATATRVKIGWVPSTTITSQPPNPLYNLDSYLLHTPVYANTLYIMQLYISVCTVPLVVNEVKKLIPAERELCIPVPSKVYTPTKHAIILVKMWCI